MCVFVNDTVNEKVVNELYDLGVRVITLRCAGFNNVDTLSLIHISFQTSLFSTLLRKLLVAPISRQVLPGSSGAGPAQ